VDYRSLGNTGLSVSAVSLGTVELGVDYGIRMPGEFGRPAARESVEILTLAREAGINLFDTAPAYGAAEEILGKTLKGDDSCIIATKISPPRDETGKMLSGRALEEKIGLSLDRSRIALRRDRLDIVQLHNPSVQDLTNSELADVLLEACSDGIVRFLGASVYTVEEAKVAIKSGLFTTLQVAYNLLDRRMAASVFTEAEKAGVALITRSALLKGVLSEKALHLPQELDSLRDAADCARETMAVTWRELPVEAIRYCLGESRVASVLVGVRSQAELRSAQGAASKGPLACGLREKLAAIKVKDENLLNPSLWPVA